MSFDFITQYDSPFYTVGRPYGIACIVIHWWGDPAEHPTFEGVINTLSTEYRSANYVAESGRVACLVDPDNRSWATGDGINVNSMGNDRGISIECNPRQSDGDYQTIGELIANIRSVYGDLPLYRHRDFSVTECPGGYDLARLDAIARGTAVSQPSAPAAPGAQPVDIDALANAVIRGDYGVGEERRARLGANYDAVQARVNEILGAGTAAPGAQPVDIDALANAVIRGDYGVGEERRARLGANYDAVQARVNQILLG